ncbi:MAG: hypothetical protein EB025_05595 [Chitinophagaceae bacterium]|nr:hypothetical protein [Chitinophagaceae bacterium]
MNNLTRIKDRLSSNKLIARILKKSRSTTLPGFSGVPIYNVVEFFIKQVQTIGMTERASATCKPEPNANVRTGSQTRRPEILA